jgi:hypothetical protein
VAVTRVYFNIICTGGPVMWSLGSNFDLSAGGESIKLGLDV